MQLTSFDDLIGLAETKEMLKRNVLLALSDPDLFPQYRVTKGAGILFYGPPGTGKTALARALNGEANHIMQPKGKEVKLFIGKLNEIIGGYAGDSEKAVHKFFENARSAAPAIVFFDEVDAMAMKRSEATEGGTNYMKLAVDQFLTELDGIDTNRDNLFVIGATNQPWGIEPAMKRPGRFDLSIYFKPPSAKERRQLFRFYMKDRPQERINWKRLGRATVHYSQADIKRIVDEAARHVMVRVAEDGIQRPITTQDLLAVLRNKTLGKSSLEEWYNNVIKEFRMKVDRKKNRLSMKDSVITPQDRILYAELLKDLNDWVRNRNKDAVFRWIAIHAI